MKTIADIGGEMLTAHIEPMSVDTSQFFIQLMLREEDKYEDINDFSYKVLKTKLEFYNCSADKRTMIFVAYICDRVGTVILYATAIKAIHNVINVQREIKTKVTFEDFILSFPLGFPIEEELHRIWDGQKDEDGNNMVDRKPE